VGRAFGIFYMMVNVGEAFSGPVIAGYVRAISWDHVFWLSSIAIGINLLIALVFLEDDSPERVQTAVDQEKDQPNADPLLQTASLEQTAKATHDTSTALLKVTLGKAPHLPQWQTLSRCWAMAALP
jgi:dipeptide/tripeptide permease